MNHLKGPWLSAPEDETFIYALGESGTNKFWMHVQSAGPERVSDSEKKDIARLIKLAPELLDALKAASLIIGHPDDAMSRYFKELIAKAEGQS